MPKILISLLLPFLISSVHAQQLLPSKGASNVSTYPTFVWSSADYNGGLDYLEISSAGSFSDTLLLKQLGETGSQMSCAVAGFNTNKTYYWRVIVNVDACEGSCPLSGWSGVWSFTTSSVSTVPALSSPTNGTGNLPVTPTLAWSAVSGMSQYQVQVSTVNVLSSTIYQGWTTSTQAVIPPLLNNKGYYWWVRAVDNSADTTGWSAIWKFSTVIAAPALSSPANGMSYTQPLTLSWGTVSGAASYQVEVSASSTFANTVLFQSGKTLTSGSVSGLTANALYYWRAAALTVGVTAWSAAWNFILLGPESAPTLISPANGSISLPPTVNLSWTAVSGTLSYGVQVSTSSFFATTLSDQSCQPDSLTVSGLANGTTFYWRVLSGNMGVSSDWSTSWSFTTIIAAPALSSPRDGMSSTLPVNFTWGTCTNATGYELQVSTSSAFGAPLVDETGQGMTGATVNSPLSGGTYYWRVASSNTTETVWSGIWSFVAVPPPGVPVLSSPTNGSIASIPVTFNWSNSAGTIAYKLSIATSSSFATTVVDQDFANNTATVSVLSLRTTYFWRVSAGGSGGTSAWSGIWSFTTASTGIAIDGLLSRRTNFKIAGNRLEYTLAHECPVDLRICDILGRTLLDLHRVQAEGNYSISLKTPGFGSGLFLVSFKAGTIDMQTVVVGERRRE